MPFIFEFYIIFMHQTHLQLIDYHDNEKNSLFTCHDCSPCNHGVIQQLRRRASSCKKGPLKRYHTKPNTRQGGHEHSTDACKKDDLGHFINHKLQFA